ncbi:alpha-ketoacid dehydrogenase subunit alpha/beta [Leifsonia bigeumensis]|uniref:dihydrolipoyllysine-residue succinyltransferase n=1 Tax=Leifsonella bigeumensis TaxID=433643 RepID=A0ABP7FI00_9MICO
MRNEALTVRSAYRHMSLIRRFEERVLELSAEGLAAGSIHPCLGQEAIPVGALAALQPQDRVLATYRGHGWALACGSEPAAVLGEIAQRAGGTNGGRAGSALLSDPDAGFLGENSIVGAGVPIADGVALAARSQGTGRVVVTSIGDGAMNQGSTSEGMIFAAANNLPVIFLCENNGWSEMTPISRTTRGADLAVRGTALGIESHVVDGLDPFAVEKAVSQAAEVCRRGEGPVLLECKTVRLKGHYNKDIEHYRPTEDQEAATAADPIARLRNAALDHGLLEEQDLRDVDAEVASIIDDATLRVRSMPLPDPATVLDHLYGEVPVPGAVSGQVQTLELTYQRAANLALRTELENRPEVLVYGEDVGFSGGIFGVTRGLQKEFGSERVFDTPISESAILGSAIGAAMEGMRPVVEIMWADFVFVALDQIVNQATNVRYINRSRLHAPLTIRMQQGVTPGSCAQHSQSIEAFFAHMPGIKVGLPSTPQDAYDMLRAAVADPDPTVLIEARELYQESASVEVGGPLQRAEGARVHRDGEDVAIITWGAMLHRALAAAERLQSESISATVLDLRWLRPLDEESIASVVERCRGRVLVVHEATETSGFGAEVVTRITERCFDELPSPVVRLGTPDVRMPSAPNLQQAVVPTSEKIYFAVRALLGR